MPPGWGNWGQNLENLRFFFYFLLSIFFDGILIRGDFLSVTLDLIIRV